MSEKALKRENQNKKAIIVQRQKEFTEKVMAVPEDPSPYSMEYYKEMFSWTESIDEKDWLLKEYISSKLYNLEEESNSIIGYFMWQIFAQKIEAGENNEVKDIFHKILCAHAIGYNLRAQKCSFFFS